MQSPENQDMGFPESLLASIAAMDFNQRGERIKFLELEKLALSAKIDRLRAEIRVLRRDNLALQGCNEYAQRAITESFWRMRP